MYKFKFFFLFLSFGFPACVNKSVNTDNSINKSSARENKISLKIEKSGGDIWGKAPRYALSIEPDGKIIFEGIENTDTKGKVESILNQEKMNQISVEINNADFFSLKNSYTSASDNCPTAETDGADIIIFIRLNDKEKKINHYLGCISGKDGKVFPQQLYNLENKIDEIVETKRWIGEGK